MPNDLDAKLDELLDGDDPQPAAEPEAQPESTPAPEIKFADLDAVVPDDEHVPEAYRRKPLADVIRVAEQHKYEAKVAAQHNQEWNRMQAERDAANLALKFFQSERQNAAQPSQQPTETQEDYLNRLALQPQSTIHSEIDGRMVPLNQRVQNAEAMLLQTQAELAKSSARETLGLDRGTWSAIEGQVATFMASQNWPVQDPRAWASAADWYIRSSLEMARRFAPQQQLAPAPVDVPRPGAPPNGTARSQSRPAAQTRLKPAVQGILDDIAEASGLDKDRRARLAKFAADNMGGL